MKTKEEEHENHAKSFQMKTNQPKEIINQSLNPKTMFDRSREFSLWDFIKPHMEYIIRHE